MHSTDESKTSGRARWITCVIACSVLLAISTPSHAFGIAPKPEDFEALNPWQRVLRWISQAEGDAAEVAIQSFARPVHEQATKIAYYTATGKPPPAAVLQGVQWNDNPPFELTPEQISFAPTCATLLIKIPSAWPGCWLMVFGTSSRRSAPPGDGVTFGPEAPILSRSHFGDMQFLHAMARDGDAPERTQEAIFEWAKFVYAVAQGDLSPSTVVSDVPRLGAMLFPANFPLYQRQSVRELFAYKAVGVSDDDLRDIAFGSLLHLIEDSFSKAHVLRESGDLSNMRWGRICEFHGYAHQDHGKHAAADSEEGLAEKETEPFVVAAIKEVVLVRQRQGSWETDLLPMLKNIFGLAANARVAGPGAYAARVPGMIGPRGEDEVFLREVRHAASSFDPPPCGSNPSPTVSAR